MITYLEKDIQLTVSSNEFPTEYQIPTLDSLVVWGVSYVCIDFKRDFKQDEFVDYYSPVIIAPSCKNYIYSTCYDFLTKNVGFSTLALDIDNMNVVLHVAHRTHRTINSIYKMKVSFEIFNPARLIQECDSYYRWVNGIDIG